MFRPSFLCVKSGPVSHLKSGNSPPQMASQIHRMSQRPGLVDAFIYSYTHIQLGGGFNAVEKY